MFPLRKLAELSPRTRFRKAARILHAAERELLREEPVDLRYLGELASILRHDVRGTQRWLPAGAAEILSADAEHLRVSLTDPRMIHRALNALRNDILRALGEAPAEWDLLSSETGLLDRGGITPFPLRAYLEDVRSPFNVGSMFRTAEALGMERLFLSARTASPLHPRAQKTARGAVHAVPWSVADLSDLPGPVFALELGGAPVTEFAFPSAGTVLVGSEELGLSPEALSRASRELGRVSIPLFGAKHSLNVAVAFGILASCWSSRVRPEANALPRQE